MSTFKDILDTISGLEGEMTQFIISGKQHKSLAKSSMEGVLNFPVLVSDSLSIEDAGLVSKALEKQFASFTLVCMTMNPYLYTSGAPNASKYIKQFHQNVDTKADMTDVINTVTGFMQEAATKLDIDYEQVEEVSQHMVYHIYEGVNHAGLNQKNIKYNYSVSEIANPKIVNTFNRKSLVLEASYDTIFNVNDGGVDVGGVDVTNNINGHIDSGALGRGIGSAMSRGRNGGSGAHGYKDVKFLMDNDYKKANELVPTLIHIRIFPVDKISDTELDPIDFVLGVKATLHPISSEEMVVNIVRGIKNDDKMFNFIRWTTGEIKFFKDFVFAMNDLKLDAVNTSSKASRWWTMLKRRKALARIKNVIMPNKLLPNATIVITQEEVDILREQYGYNLANTNLIVKLMNAYFLIAFVIVDPALQRVKFLFDGKNEFDTLTYATLAREATTNDKQFKEMVNMLGRRI